MTETIDFTFDAQRETLIEELGRVPSRDRTKNLCRLFYPIWDAYLKYFLYKGGIYDNDPDFWEYYNSIFMKCVEKLGGLKHSAETPEEQFRMVKCYYQKCILGWVMNAIVAERKGRARMVHDVGLMATMSERTDDFKEFEQQDDMKKLELHVREQHSLCNELYSLLYEGRSSKDMKRMTDNFRGRALEEYAKTGKLLSAQRFVGARVAKIFVD